MQIQTAIVPAALAPADDTLVHPIWPPAVIIFGLGLSVAWAALLVYGLVKLIELAI
jgi:hypothetical protein